MGIELALNLFCNSLSERSEKDSHVVCMGKDMDVDGKEAEDGDVNCRGKERERQYRSIYLCSSLP